MSRDTSPTGPTPSPGAGAASAGLDLPTLQEAVLDTQTLEQLFIDVGAHTQVLEVLFKGGATEHSAAATPSLEQARAALVSGAVRAVQLRYLHEGQEWWDTLLRTPLGVRLVRIRHEPPPTAAPPSAEGDRSSRSSS